jgi:hypothetical protein
MRTQRRDTKTVKIKCNHCGFESMTEYAQYQVGDILKAYAGGGDHGFCGRCKRTDTMVVIEMPAESPKAAPGWARIPDK